MTGPEHYKEAERLLATVEATAEDTVGSVAATVAQAQVHATLALAAATALKPPSRARWGKVAGRQEEAR